MMFLEQLRYRRIHIMRQQVFDDAAIVSPDWNSAVKKRIQDTGGREILAQPAPENAWQAYESRLRRFSLKDCCSIDVFDNRAAVIQRLCYGDQEVIVDAEFVSDLADTLLAMAAELGTAKVTVVGER